MVLRLLILVWLGCLTAAGPVAWDDSKCSQQCNGGSKYQYSQQTSYIYSYESSNEMQADRASDLSVRLKATVRITVVSKCEMVLQLSDVTLQHGPLQESSSPFIEQLQRNPLPFSWNDGKIEHTCPNPEDSDDVNNIKKGILSTFQNTMRSFDYDMFNVETDVLGACDTDYTIKEQKADKYVILKTKNILTCTNHLKGQTLFLASPYDSSASRQHLPFLSGEKSTCTQTIENGILEKVQCEEKASFKPLSDYGYVVEATGKATLEKLSSEPASRIVYKTPGKESLVFQFRPQATKNDNLESEVRSILQDICDKSADLISKDAASDVHRLVYTIRRMNQQSLESVYASLKSKELCSSGKALSIYIDALKAASSGGAIGLLSNLIESGDISKLEAMIWETFLPFTSYVEEDSISGAIPLLRKDSANRQALLGVTAMAYKYCTSNPECESSRAIKDVSSKLKQFLGDKCQTTSHTEEMQILTALKAFGNLGYIGDSKGDIFECASTPTNKIEIRIAAIEAFRRAPCSEEVILKLLNIYKNKNEVDELRIAALISLSKCASQEIIRNVLEVYSSESSKQVEVFTWSYLKNLQSTSDPLKAKLQNSMSMTTIRTPLSTDITKFSRNFEWSLFSELLNLGHGIDANIIHSSDSFLPKSGNLGLKVNLFGNQINAFEVGGRAEGLEHMLEKLFGPHGMIQNIDIFSILDAIPEKIRRKRSIDSIKSKIEALSERLGYNRNKIPQGSAFLRVMGHELGVIYLNKDSLKRVAGINISDMLKTLASMGDINAAKSLLFVDVSVLFPSITGRAYKLASNGSITLGLKSNGKIDLQQPHLPIPRALIDGRFQPSILAEESASFTIHSEDFEPGVKALMAINAGVDIQARIELKDGRLFHVKLDRMRDRSEIFSLKRTLYSLNHRGQTELPKPKSYNLNYCTKYVQHLLGARYCGSLTFPHVYNEAGKPKIPFVREMEASFVVEKTDPNMEGYEALLEIPDFMSDNEMNFRILLDTPKSSVNRKFSVDLKLKQQSEESCLMDLNAYTPFYTLDVNGNMMNNQETMQMKIEALGDKKRRYAMLLDVTKDVKGARLVEYQPRIALTIHGVRPIDLTGKVVFSRGRKEQITLNLQSDSFDSTFTVKGNMAKEGDITDLDTNWKMNSEIHLNAFTQIHRIQGALGNEAGKGIFLEFGHHYEPDGKSYESITLNAKVTNIEFRDRLRFSLDSQILLAEHQDLNTMLKWDFSFRPLHHLNNDLIFRYGENFEDDTHLVRFIVKHALHGDFDHYQKLSVEHKIGLTISCFDFDKSAALSAAWDFVDTPKMFVEVGIKSQKDKEKKFEFNYNHLSAKPLKIGTEMTLTFNDFKIKYRDQAVETAPHEYQGNAVLEGTSGQPITIDYTYRIKSQENFHHEFDGRINFPGMSDPVRQKVLLAYSEDNAKFNSFTDVSGRSQYTIDANLQRKGQSEITLVTPYVEGKVSVDSNSAVHTLSANFKAKGRDDRRVIVSGSIKPGDENKLDLDVQWDADKDSQKKITLTATSFKQVEDGIEKHMISGSISYVGSINVDITGKLSTDLLRGPHYFRADFSGNMEPMAIECEHEIKEGKMNSVAKYLRSGVEKLRMDLKGKFIQQAYHFEVEAGLSLSSPYKTFDGKELYFRIMADSNAATRDFVAEYRIKPAAVIGYVGKLDYQRKRGWPGQIRSTLLVTVHRRPIYEGSTHLDYGNGKYSWKTSFTPISKRKIQFLASFEHAARFAAFHHSLVTSLEYLQTVEVNAIADLRDIEDAKMQSMANVNDHKLYDVNATMKMRSMIDFDGQIVLFSKITPSVHVFSKAQTSGQLTKYEVNLDIDSKSIITGGGELKKRKKGLNGDIVFKYKEKEFLVLTISQEAKSKQERNYVIKAKTPSRLYTSNIRVNKEKKGNAKYETKFCRNEADDCVQIDVFKKEPGETNEYQISYKRGSVEFSIERIRVSTDRLSRFHTVIFNGDKRYGYDLRLSKEGNGQGIRLGIILPSREIITKGVFELSLKNPKVKFELSADGRNHPDRKLITDLEFDNHLWDDKPSKLDVTISHPIFEKPIKLELSGDLELSSPKFFTSEVVLDYSNNPEDKLIGKLSIERSPGGSGTLLINIYHQDDQHLDFVIKANGTFNSNEKYFSLTNNWKDENNADVESYLIAHYPIKEKKFYFVYHRPKLSYRLDGAIATPENLLGDTCEVDLVSVYNEETTKAKLISDYSKGCHKLTIFDDQGGVSRVVELCINFRSRKLITILTESFDADGEWTFDYSCEIVQKSWNALGIRHHANSDFLGKFLFQLTGLADELQEAGVGTLPLSESPRYKIIHKSFESKVLKPAQQFFIPEARKFVEDMKDDMTFLGQALRNYYNSLPSLSTVKENLESLAGFIKFIMQELWTHIYSYYESYIRTVLQFVDKVRETIVDKCVNNDDCKAFIRAYNEGGWKSLLIQLKNFIVSLPGKIQQFIERPSADIQNFFKKAFVVLKAALQPLTKYRCGEIVVKVVQLSYEALEPHVETILSNLPTLYRQTKENIMSNPYVLKSIKFVKEQLIMIQEELSKIDYNRLYILAKKYLEDYLANLNLPIGTTKDGLALKPPTFTRILTVNKINSEQGIIDMDIHLNVLNKIVSRITGIVKTVTLVTLDAMTDYNWNTILVKFKRGMNLDFFPPYQAQAMIVSNQYFVTFDKAFYDFAGECGYLLSRDFEDGNFTFALKPKEGDQDPSILMLVKDMAVEVNSATKLVKVGDNEVELPYLSKDILVTRAGSTLIVDDKHGVQVKCNLVHQICTFVISGWYFGKTAGLLGTYNYETFDEFKRPKGQIANSPTVMAKSWELKRGCKTSNLVPDVQISKNSDYYRQCKSHFEASTSPLAACFSEVDPKDYFQLCLRHLARDSSSKKALCNVATAYVVECERHYIELNLPSKCLTCDAPDGSKMQHGDRKKYENLNKKSADVVFIVEDHECNKIMANDLSNLARSIDRELQNEGFKDNRFGVVGFGGEIGSPKIYTSKGETFFNSRDVNMAAERIKMESKKVDSSTVFEAMKLAVTYLFRSETSKSFVLLSCSPCKYDYSSLQYPVIQQILLERGISLHVIQSAEIAIRKSSIKDRDVIGVDPDTVYHAKDVTQPDLIGEPDLRSQVSLPKDICVALSQDVNGSFFSTHPIKKASSNEIKNWRSVFARKFLKAVQLFQCQLCDCTSTRDHIPNTVCQPCEIKRPRLPFSVGRSNVFTRTVESFLSYILHIIRA